MADRFPVTIAGHELDVELEGFTRTTMDTIRSQADESSRTGEQTLSPDDLWRRSQSDWRGGEGQEWGDVPDSNPTRYDESAGIDPWTRGRFSVLSSVLPSDTDPDNTTDPTRFHTAVVLGKDVVVGIETDGTDVLSFEWDASSETQLEDAAVFATTSTGSFVPEDIATDGSYVYIANGADGVDRVHRESGGSGNVVDSFDEPGTNPQGLSHDGTNLWNADWDTTTIYKLDPSDGSVVDSFAAPAGFPTGVSHDGTNLWVVVGGGTIYKLDPSDGSVLDSFAAPDTTPRGLSHDGTNLWLSGQDSDLIYKINPSTGSTISSFASPGTSPWGLSHDGSNLWHSDENSDLIYKLDPSDGSVLQSFSSPGAIPTGLSHDGTNLWNADPGDGLIYKISLAGTPAADLLNTVNAEQIWYILGRLMVTFGAEMYNITDPTVTTPPDDMSPLTVDDKFVWTDMAAGGSRIYACGSSGSRGTIYQIELLEDGTALAAPRVAAHLPFGEKPLALLEYAGVMFIGTDQGFRIARAGGEFLAYGPLIDVGRCGGFAARGSNVFFEYGDRTDGVGVGRCDLSAPLVGELQPAFAKDAVATVSVGATPRAIVADVGQVFFVGSYLFFNTVANSNSPSDLEDEVTWFVKSAVATADDGTLTTSKFDFAVPDSKTFEFFTIRVGDITADDEVAVDIYVDGDLDATKTITGAGAAAVHHIAVKERGEKVWAEIDVNGGAFVERYTFKAFPIPPKGEIFVLPLALYGEVEDSRGNIKHLDVRAVYDDLAALATDGTVTSLTLFGTVFRAVIDRVQFGDGLTYLPNKDFVEGVCYLQVRTWQEA